MEPLAFIRNQFEYDAWANREVLACLERAPNPGQKMINLLAHILAASGLWLSRLKQEPPPVPTPFPVWTLGECREKIEEMNLSWKRYLATLELESLDVPMPYRTTEGTPHTNLAEDIIFQVINHGSHHRGQIASALRAAGETPAVLDYIVYMRRAQAE